MEGFFEGIFQGLADFIVMIFNFLIKGVGIVLSWIALLFPDTPFKEPLSPPDAVNLSHIAWFIPYTDMILHAGLLCTAIITYYSIRVLARWIKMVRN